MSLSSTSAVNAGRADGHFTTPWAAGHEGEAPFGLLAKQPEIGRRIADAEHAQGARIGPAPANAAADEAAGNHAKLMGIKVSQVDDVYGHGAILSRTSERI